MVEYKNEKLDALFHALADSTRRDLLGRLKSGNHRITELASHYDVSLNAISKHIKVLEKAELIQRNVNGRVHHCNINSEKLKEVERWMEPYRELWAKSLDNLENYLIQKGD